MIATSVAACGDRRHPPSPTEASPAEPIAADVIDAARPDALHHDLPPAGQLGAVRGTLAGRAFAPAKIDLWIAPRGARLSFDAPAHRPPCVFQPSPGADDLYLSFQFPAEHARAGGAVTDQTRDAIATWKKPSFDPVEDRFVLAIDEIDAGAARARGRLRITGADGTRVAGAFEAALCRSPQRDLPPPELHGRSWRDAPGPPRELPRAALAAVHVGDRITPALVVLIDAARSDSMHHELVVYRALPPDPCAPGLFLHEGGFKLALGHTPPTTGFALDVHVTLVNPRGTPFAVAIWEEPVGAVGMEGEGDVSLILDDVGPDEVRGRVVARFRDPAKSMLAGAFTARRCR